MEEYTIYSVRNLDTESPVPSDDEFKKNSQAWYDNYCEPMDPKEIQRLKEQDQFWKDHPDAIDPSYVKLIIQVTPLGFKIR